MISSGISSIMNSPLNVSSAIFRPGLESIVKKYDQNSKAHRRTEYKWYKVLSLEKQSFTLQIPLWSIGCRSTGPSGRFQRVQNDLESIVAPGPRAADLPDRLFHL